ncbi:hypothetical protein BDW69DRAFT_118558 [Aspergillus filifer]
MLLPHNIYATSFTSHYNDNLNDLATAQELSVRFNCGRSPFVAGFIAIATLCSPCYLGIPQGRLKVKSSGKRGEAEHLTSTIHGRTTRKPIKMY